MEEKESENGRAGQGTHGNFFEALFEILPVGFFSTDPALGRILDAKALAPRLATNAIRDCLALHGHYGYTLDLPIEQRLRDILGLEIADGTSQVSKIVAVRELFRKEFLPYGQGRL